MYITKYLNKGDISVVSHHSIECLLLSLQPQSLLLTDLNRHNSFLDLFIYLFIINLLVGSPLTISAF